MGEPRTSLSRNVLRHLTIKAEARAELLAELRAKVEALPNGFGLGDVLRDLDYVPRAAVLALLSPDTGAPGSTQKEKE